MPTLEDGVRTCKKCGATKPLTDFRESKPGYRRRTCSECMDRHAVEWQQQNKARLLKWRKSYYQQNRDKQIEAAKEWNVANPEGFKRNTSSRYHKLREQAIMAYGGKSCACCGEEEPMFLSIDHVNNDQCDFAKKLGRPHTGLFLVTWLQKNGYPLGFQVLCHNCNQGKRINGGVCPHQVNKA